MCSRKRLTFIKDFINNESVCHFMVVQLFKLSTKDKTIFIHLCCHSKTTILTEFGAGNTDVYYRYIKIFSTHWIHLTVQKEVCNYSCKNVQMYWNTTEIGGFE